MGTIGEDFRKKLSFPSDIPYLKSRFTRKEPRRISWISPFLHKSFQFIKKKASGTNLSWNLLHDLNGIFNILSSIFSLS